MKGYEPRKAAGGGVLELLLKAVEDRRKACRQDMRTNSPHYGYPKRVRVGSVRSLRISVF